MLDDELFARSARRAHQIEQATAQATEIAGLLCAFREKLTERRLFTDAEAFALTQDLFAGLFQFPDDDEDDD